jgi:SAM-dependent methyltransferase
MTDCCVPRGYEKLFGEKTARRDLKRYRRKGLDETAERMVEFLRSRGVERTTVLEIGGGVGAIEVELLKAGAERAVNVELSPYYEAAARELWDEQGVADRIEYRVANIAEDGKDVGLANIVLMHRVVCCYSDYDALVGAAAERTGRYLVMSYPREGAVSRLVVRAINLVARMLRWEHRSYVHPIAEILAAAERRGLNPVLRHRGFVWHMAALERASAA